MTGKIRQELEQVDWNSPKEIVSFYDSNILYFNHVNIDTDISKSEELIDVKLSYSYALIDLGHFTKCYQVIKTLNIGLNGIKNKKTNKYREKYEKYLFAEGVVLSKLKRYEESLEIFNELINIDPEKNLYGDWLKSLRTTISLKQLSFLGWLGFGIVMVDMFLGIVFDIHTGKYTSIIGFIIMTIGFFLPYLIQWIRNAEKK